MFTNKHVIIAMIVAPILAILAWFAVGELGGEKPHRAVPGQSYPLVEKSNCRYDSGVCDLQNEGFKLSMAYREDGPGRQLVLRSSHTLEGVAIAVGDPGDDRQPDMMLAADGQGLEWRIALAARPAPEERIRLVARSAGSTWFADASTAFLQPSERAQLQR